MEMQFEKLLTRVTDFIQNEAKSETVIGNPFKLGAFDCIPVIRLGIGLGTGGGEGEGPGKQGHGEGMAAGGGLGVEPIGFLVTKGDEISFISAKTNSGLAAAFEKVPDLLEKYLETKTKATTKES